METVLNDTAQNRQDAAAHSAPCSNKDFDFFYAGLEQQQLMIQQCADCGELRNPPAPCCPSCRSLTWSARAVSGRGTLYSYVVHHHPPLPGFETPHPVALVELDEGVRFVGAMDGTSPEELKIGMPVTADYLRRGAVASVRFKPV